MKDMNKALAGKSPEQALSDDQLNSAFEMWWPKLEKCLKSIPASSAPVKKRGQEEMIEEILTLVREIARRPSLSELSTSPLLQSVLGRETQLSPSQRLAGLGLSGLRLSDFLTDVSGKSPIEATSPEIQEIERKIARALKEKEKKTDE